MASIARNDSLSAFHLKLSAQEKTCSQDLLSGSSGDVGINVTFHFLLTLSYAFVAIPM